MKTIEYLIIDKSIYSDPSHLLDLYLVKAMEEAAEDGWEPLLAISSHKMLMVRLIKGKRDPS